ncbi:MAG: hypothetical protein U5L11_12095 [Arhodomonas sp.]|nr:hypothetical protein [Arhodomonas sp.]
MTRATTSAPSATTSGCETDDAHPGLETTTRRHPGRVDDLAAHRQHPRARHRQPVRRQPPDPGHPAAHEPARRGRRFFSEFIARDIRMAGYSDCPSYSGPGMEWDEDSHQLTLRYCADDGGGSATEKEVVYEFASNQREVSYSETGPRMMPEELLRI